LYRFTGPTARRRAIDSEIAYNRLYQHIGVVVYNQTKYIYPALEPPHEMATEGESPTTRDQFQQFFILEHDVLMLSLAIFAFSLGAR
jgi:hypothetical protein